MSLTQTFRDYLADVDIAQVEAEHARATQEVLRDEIQGWVAQYPPQLGEKTLHTMLSRVADDFFPATSASGETEAFQETELSALTEMVGALMEIGNHMDEWACHERAKARTGDLTHTVSTPSTHRPRG